MTGSDIWTDFRAGRMPDRAEALRLAELEVLRQSGLFDPVCYRARNGGLPEGADPLADYHDHGWRQGHWPNPYFDPAWYRTTYPDVAETGGDPLLHYASYGEAEGRRPVEWFDPAWYRVHHQVPPGTHCLRHFLLNRTTGRVSPIEGFDSAWYLAAYPDVAAAAMDPMEHYLVQGFREGRNPSPDFDTRFYRLRYLRGLPDEIPLLHYLRHRDQPGVFTRLPPGETTLAREVRRFAAPGPLFEPVNTAPAPSPRARALAFYLPQFHPIAQNDAWWGAGFTEWTNVARGLPRFTGHYQPRIPRDLGHYRLDDPATLPRQAALARAAGISGFVFYFYWFDRQRLLERPLEQLLADPAIDCPFCLIWANENWSRRWDGSDQEVLIAQSYALDDEPALIDCFARHFADPRYIRLDGRPLLMIYRPGLIPDPAATIPRWRALFRTRHGQDPILVMAQSFGDDDPRRFGLDGAVEFPPHKLVSGLSLINHTLDLLDHECDAQVYSYDAAVTASCAAPPPDYNLIGCAMPGWDNDARRQGHGMVMHGATPARFGDWLAHLADQAQARPFFGTPLLCINAWNEWAEGAYLEPDQHYGAAFLNAARRALCGPAASHAAAPNRLLLVGHDAFAAGAQLLLLHLARHLTATHGVQLEILLAAGGALEADYRAIAPVHIADAAALPELLHRLAHAGFGHAIVNSAAAAGCLEPLAARGIRAVLLVHEMPGLLAARDLLAPLAAGLPHAHSVVFASTVVRDALAAQLPLDPARCAILPQGLYRPPSPDPAASAALREAWGIPPEGILAIGVGHGDRRKGLDLFLEVWRHAAPAHHVHMAWIGSIDPTLAAERAEPIAAAEQSRRFRLTGWRDDIATILGAADLYLLTSREDPYPSAALEALHAGTPVIAFEGSGGIPPLLEAAAGTVVPMGATEAMAALVATAVRPVRRGSLLQGETGFAAYAASLAARALPERALPTVIVTCYRQAALLPRRLHSIFGQTAPIRDLAIHDDASDDGSADAAASILRAAGRSAAINVAPRNSGSPFGLWREAVGHARGDIVWIAEADDDAEPAFLERLLPAFADPATVLAFCDSRPVDADGNPCAESYAASYQQAGGAGALAADAVYDSRAFARRFLTERNILFNVSAVLWRRDALAYALDRLGDELPSWRVAGDWRLYVELMTGAPGRVAHIAEALNRHCRAAGTASARLAIPAHLAEIRRMHALLRARFPRLPGLRARQARFLAEAEAYLRSKA